jgi:outer membrane lipoprotein-sorting protein
MKNALLTIILASLTVMASSQTAEEIIQRMDDNETWTSVKMVGAMRIEDNFGQNVSEFISYSQGEDDMLIEFTSEYEAGQKILRKDNKIYLYFPDAEETIILQGAALKQSMMGSDVSYEDMAGERTTLDDYDATLLGEETIDGRETWQIDLTAKEGNYNVPYARQVVWVDKATDLAVKVDMYSLSGRQIKTLSVSDIRRVGEKWVAYSTVIKDLLRGNSQTELLIQDIEINPSIRSGMFSIRSLSR